MDNIENTQKELTLEEVLAMPIKLEDTVAVEFKQDEDAADPVVI